MSALLRELAAVLTRPDYASLRCVPDITTDEETGLVELRISVRPGEQASDREALTVLSLFADLQYVCDLAQMRALCERYDIKAEALEALLPEPRE